MQSLECVELLLFVLLPKMSVPDIKNNLGLWIKLNNLNFNNPKSQLLDVLHSNIVAVFVSNKSQKLV